MERLTPSQLRHAIAMAQRIRQKEAQAAALRSLVNAGQVALGCDFAARYQRCNFRHNPALFAGIDHVYSRTVGEHRDFILASYRQFLDGIGATEFPTPPIDFAALRADARPYLLPPFLGLRIGDRFPHLDLGRSNVAAGTLIYVSPGGPFDLQSWTVNLSKISGWLGGNWEITSSSVSAVTLSRREPLPSVIPFDRRLIKAGSLFLGYDVSTRKQVHLPIAAMTSGTFLHGSSGSGKSNALHVLMQSVLANLHSFTAVYVVDGKDGVAAHRYRNAALGKLHVLWDEPDLWTLTTELVATMRARNAAQRDAGVDNATKDFILVVIDEVSTYSVKPSSDGKSEANKRHARFLDELAMLARRGRSVGIRLIITAQEPVDDQIPTTIRTNCQTVVGFRLPTVAHATAVYGPLEGLPADPRKLGIGRALLKDGTTGELLLVQFPAMPVRRPA